MRWIEEKISPFARNDKESFFATLRVDAMLVFDFPTWDFDGCCSHAFVVLMK